MKIRNWDKWQTFRKDRSTPPWLKLHRNLLSNPEWVSLSDSEKGQLVSIWILASDKNGSIPDDPGLIKKMAILDSEPNINKFIELGFLVTNRLPDGCQHDVNLTQQSRVEESRGEEIIKPNGLMSRKRDVEHLDDIKMLYGELNKRTGTKFEYWQNGKLTRHATWLQARLKEHPGDVDIIFYVIHNRCTVWEGNDDMKQYLRPSTLFRKSNFDEYKQIVYKLRKSDEDV